MRKYFKSRYILGILVLLLGVTWPMLPFANAATSTGATTTTAASGAITQSYNAEPSVLPSMIVEFKPKEKTTVIPLSINDINNMLGVVVPADNATIVLTPQSTSTQQVIVAANGRYNVLVSNQNGPIKAGDYLAISTLSGVSMKAGTDQTLVVGRAVSSFSGGSSSLGSVSLKGSQGHAASVSIGRITADVQLAPNPLFLKSSNSIIGFLTKAEYGVTNKPVSPPRTYLSSVIFLITLLITVIVLYTGTRTAIIASSRNPLAKTVIGRSLIKTILTGIIVFATGTFVVYLILNH